MNLCNLPINNITAVKLPSSMFKIISYVPLMNGNCVVLLLLDHSILLERLICGTALEWLQSYLADRSKFVLIEGEKSSTHDLEFGVPQGSVLGPILSLLYTSPLADILRSYNMSFHRYADDTQLYVSFTTNDGLAWMYIPWLTFNHGYLVLIHG